MNEYRRSRVYYTKAQITTGLITEGGEWMFLDTTEYIGQYHKYSSGEVFSESNFVDGKSRKLIPYVDVKKLGSTDSLGLDIVKNYEYNLIKSVDVKKTFVPNTGQSEITETDLKRLYFERYFAYKRNDGRILELTKEDYGKVGSKDGLSDVLWEKFKLRWKIRGPVRDVLDGMGNVSESGVFDTNKRTVELYSENYPTLRNYLMDFTEFYTPPQI